MTQKSERIYENTYMYVNIYRKKSECLPKQHFFYENLLNSEQNNLNLESARVSEFHFILGEKIWMNNQVCVISRRFWGCNTKPTQFWYIVQI